MKAFSCLLAVICLARLAFAYSPVIDGALANVRIKVVDDKGKVVSDAPVSVTFYTAPEKVEVKRGETDAEGLFSAKGNCVGEAYAWIRKAGYYDTRIIPKLQTLSDKEAERQRKWSVETVETVATLKKKRQPTSLKLNHRQYWVFPATNEVFFLDLESCQWCPPYGKGRHKDISLFYEAIEHPEDGWAVSYWNKLTLKMPNVVDGLYRVKTESFSKFSYAYEANANADYAKSLVLEIERKNDRMVKIDIPKDDEYFIFRTRTATNGTGQVTHANYGRIGEKLNLAIGLSIKTWFNPRDNDTNLEDARSR
ncbi:MAG: hypothetical protein ACI4RD_10965 [Kiritimatiellia bacterium]